MKYLPPRISKVLSPRLRLTAGFPDTNKRLKVSREFGRISAEVF
jgi:hypothetical protein